MVLNVSETEVLRYTVYLLFLVGDAILATKTALVAFSGSFIMIMLKIAYKEPRPYWADHQIKCYRCDNDFEGPSDHSFILMFLGTYMNLIYLRKYSRKPL